MLRLFTKRSDLSDETLLARYQAGGDLEVLGQLYGRYTELVYGVCLKYLRDEPAAEDAVMAIFEELVNKAREHDVQNFRSWLYVLAKNHCLMQLRKEKRNPTINYEPDRMHSIDPRHHSMETAEENGQEAHLRECLQQLSDAQKRCITLFYYEGHSYQEIAELLPERLGKVRSHIQNGRRNLRLCIEKKVEDERGNERTEERKNGGSKK